ncbi:hypothetical protein [Roseateles aquatilis]|nr:hypothetical protein [Roseateles aquatilis]
MMHISPVKVIAGIAAVILAVAGLFFASHVRQAAVDMLSVVRLGSSGKSAQTTRQAEVTATPSGVRVIPIGVAAPPSSGNAGQSTGR